MEFKSTEPFTEIEIESCFKQLNNLEKTDPSEIERDFLNIRKQAVHEK